MAAPVTTFTKEIGDAFCALVADGKSMRSICTEEPFPSRVTIFQWFREQPEFAAAYDKARREGAHAMIDDVMDISDLDGLDPQDKRIRVDTRKWIASKVLPKVYGDKLAIGGDEDGAPLVVTWLQSGG